MDPRRHPRVEIAILAALLLAGAVLRLWLARGQDYPSYDGCYYLNLARDLVTRGELRYSSFPPGFPLLVALALVGLGSDSPEAALRGAQLVNSLAGLALGVLTFVLVRRALGARWGLVGAAVVLFLPLSLRHSFTDVTQLVYACTLVGGLLLYESRRSSWAGLTLGFGYLVRPEALVILLVLTLRDLWRRRSPVRLLLGGAVLILPYLAYVWVETGRPLPSSKWGFLETSVETVGTEGMLSLYLRNASTLLRFLPGWLGYPMAFLVLVGVTSRGGVWRLGLLPMLLLPLFTFGMHVAYWLSALPLLVLAAALGGAEVARLLEGRRLRIAATTLVTAIALGFLVAASWRPMQEIRAVDESFPGLRATGRWLRTQVTREDLVAARKPYTSFWAGCRYRRIPSGMTTEGIVAWCQREKVDYLVANRAVALRFLPGLVSLVQEDPVPVEGLTRVGSFTVQGRPDQSTQLYAVNPRP